MLTKSDQTKQSIIEKCAPLFNKKGYAATSMADIMAATGLAKGGIYGNFSGKDEIAAEAFDHAYGQLKTALAFKVRQHKTASGKLVSILDFYHNFTVHPIIEGGCPILNTAIDADDQLPFLKEKARLALDELLGSLVQIIQKGIDTEEFKQSLDAADEARLFYATIEGGVMMGKLMEDPKVFNNILKSMKIQIEQRYRR